MQGLAVSQQVLHAIFSWIQQPGNTLWLFTADGLTAIASVGALIISLLAFFFSHRSATQQQLREKRQELLLMIDRVITVREEYEQKYARILDPQERLNFSIYSRSKQSVYIQTCEELEKELTYKNLSPQIYLILGRENMAESDFQEGREYYRKAVLAAQSGESIITQAEALRTYAWTFFMEEIRDLVEGRRMYQQAIQILEKRTDPYSIYTQSITYREWATGEFNVRNIQKAKELLLEARKCAVKIPDWNALRSEELRQIANYWMGFGNQMYGETLGSNITEEENENRRNTAREFYKTALQSIEHFQEDAFVDMRGQIYQNWAYYELVKNQAKLDPLGTELYQKAREAFSSLSNTYPPRAERLDNLERMPFKIQEKWNDLKVPGLESTVPSLRHLHADLPAREINSPQT